MRYQSHLYYIGRLRASLSEKTVAEYSRRLRCGQAALSTGPLGARIPLPAEEGPSHKANGSGHNAYHGCRPVAEWLGWSLMKRRLAGATRPLGAPTAPVDVELLAKGLSNMTLQTTCFDTPLVVKVRLWRRTGPVHPFAGAFR